MVQTLNSSLTMFARRAFQTPALRQFSKRLHKPQNIVHPIPSIRTQHQAFHFQSRRSAPLRDDRPVYEYDPNKHQSARPLFTPRARRDLGRSGFAIVVLGVGGGIYYFSHIEEVPWTGRKRFNCYSAESVAEQGDMMYRMTMDEYGSKILPEWDARSQQVQRVLNRLLPVSGIGGQWEVYVINDNSMVPFFVASEFNKGIANNWVIRNL